MKLFERKVIESRCYTTTIIKVMEKKVWQRKVYKGGKAPRNPRQLDIPK